jgi:hypothetical protein
LISLAKSVAESKGVCAAPDQRLKKKFDPEKKNAISRFYHSPEISYTLPCNKKIQFNNSKLKF